LLLSERCCQNLFVAAYSVFDTRVNVATSYWQAAGTEHNIESRKQKEDGLRKNPQAEHPLIL
jgi:hypothetical protein